LLEGALAAIGIATNVIYLFYLFIYLKAYYSFIDRKNGGYTVGIVEVMVYIDVNNISKIFYNS